jgi:protein TonB
MLISKFNFCKDEWLDLVFANRNKEYGAYYLRQHYAGNIVKAMVITFVSIVSTAIIIGFLIRVKPVTERIIQVDTKLYTVPPVPPKAEIKKEKPAAAAPKQIPPAATIKYVPMYVTEKHVDEDPPKIDEMEKIAVGPETIKVPGGGVTSNVDPDAGKVGTGTSTGPEKGTEIMIAPDVMPEPFGGAAGWMKFLQKNLRYPPEAIDKGLSGKVFVSFVVEKDGSLSNITVDRGAGFGMDEEAARVLKLAHAWKPGKQNGQPVRVKYTLPISFSMNQ